MAKDSSEEYWAAQNRMWREARSSGEPHEMTTNGFVSKKAVRSYPTASGWVMVGSEEDLQRKQKENNMSFENKPQTASVFPNKDKTAGDSQPNARGSIYLSREFLKELLTQEGDLIKADISFWTKTSAAGTPWMSGSIQKPYKLDATPAPAAPVEAPKPASDIPF
jgi:hypothetical protein